MTGKRIEHFNIIMKMSGKYIARFLCFFNMTEILAGEYENYHFSEEIGEEDIYFSYKIQKGPSTSQNGIKLLEFAGFPDVIIKNAKETVL